MTKMPTMSIFLKDELSTFDASRKIRCTSRRAVSEVIATLLMVSITVVGAVMLAAFLQNSGFASIGGSFGSNYLESQIPPSIKLIGYDTRDGNDLFGIGVLDNNNVLNTKLCTRGCESNANNLPNDPSPGTEFIVLKMKNDGVNSYTINVILINDVDHLWNGTVSGSLSSSPGGWPNAGNFRLIPSSTDLNFRSNQLRAGEEALLVIKLSQNIITNSGGQQPDIAYNLPLKIAFTGSLNAPTFIVLGGDVM